MNDSPHSEISLIPVNDCVLVRLEEQYNNFQTRESKYDTRTHGIMVAAHDLNKVLREFEGKPTLIVADLLNKRVYFEQYKEGERIKRDNELYCFIKLDDVTGFEDAKTD